jgi:hypothetical protein
VYQSMAGTRTRAAPYGHFLRMAGGFELSLRLEIAKRAGPDTSARDALGLICRLGRPAIANGCAPCTSARAALDTIRPLAHHAIANR